MNINNRAASTILLCFAGSVLAACAGASVLKGKAPLPPVPAQAKVPSLHVVADAQLHNIYGKSLRQMSSGADLASKVAIRPPELNIVGPLALWSALQDIAKRPVSERPIILFLGDATNIACTGELDEVYATFASALGQDSLVLMAHGNHDSYLMGTVNDWWPKTPRDMPLTAASDLPVDESFWPEPGTPVKGGTKNWRDACYRPIDDETSTHAGPMHKTRWMARYMTRLSNFGITARVHEHVNSGVTFVSEGTGTGALSGRNYEFKGRYYKPLPPDLLQPSYASFLVQAVDIDATHRLIILDTSVCKGAYSRLRFPFTNAGSNHCISSEEFEIVEGMVKKAKDSGKHVVLAAHAPLGELTSKQMKRLAKSVELVGPLTNYVSAHTHSPLSQPKIGRALGLEEVNVGSTTDWPMEANSFFFDPESAQISGVRPFSMAGHYRPRYFGQEQLVPTSELCRHLAAAAALLKLSEPVERYTSPSLNENCVRDVDQNGQEWDRYARELRTLREEILKKGIEDKRYREIVLGIAAAASEEESRLFQLIDLKIW